VPLGIPHSEFLSWSTEDQDKALAWLEQERLKCSNCRTYRDDWERDPFAFVAVSRQCPGCVAIASEQKNIPEENSEGWLIQLVDQETAAELTAEMASATPRRRPREGGE
jgi:hypothetical protein